MSENKIPFTDLAIGDQFQITRGEGKVRWIKISDTKINCELNIDPLSYPTPLSEARGGSITLPPSYEYVYPSGRHPFYVSHDIGSPLHTESSHPIEGSDIAFCDLPVGWTFTESFMDSGIMRWVKVTATYVTALANVNRLSYPAPLEGLEAGCISMRATESITVGAQHSLYLAHETARGGSTPDLLTILEEGDARMVTKKEVAYTSAIVMLRAMSRNAGDLDTVAVITGLTLEEVTKHIRNLATYEESLPNDQRAPF